MVRDEGRSRKPRVTLEKERLYSWQSGEGARYPIRLDASRFDSDEMLPLYENRCLTVGLVQMRLRPNDPKAHPGLTRLRAASP